MATTARQTQTRIDEPTTPAGLPSVLAVVVTHSGRTWLRDCLVALNLQTYPLLDVLVVDDASPDSRQRPAIKRIAKRHLRRRRWGHLRTPRPLGFGGAINWALGRVRTDADLLLFVHDDAALTEASVERMVARVLADATTAIVGPKIVSWDDPDRLEEIGMATDRFGYPYKGLDEGEIDLGQHDASHEVFYVTSTCMLIRQEVFRRLRGWDARMRAFSEDLDLCWRARVAGYTVRVEPQAKARHAIALARGERPSPFEPARYFIRRNRLRAVTKSASGLRLIALIPQFLLLTLVEMLGFVILRQPREIWNLARALAWNFVSLPQTLAERSRVQRHRKVPDRKLRRLTVRESTRVRAYIGHQADRLEHVWGRRAELLSRRTGQAKALTGKLRGLTGVLLFVGLLGFLLGFRDFLLSPPAAIGELLPFPERLTAVWRAWGSPWRGVGLGQEATPVPALGILGFVPVLTLGAAGVAQKVLVLGLGAVAFAGMHHLVSDMVDRPARFAAGLAYALGSVGYSGVREGALGALFFGAAAPFVLAAMLQLTGWTRPPRWNRGRAVARVVLGAAVSAAFVPGSLFLYAACAVVLAVVRGLVEPGARAFRGFTSCAVALVLAWVVLLPWSASWLAEGGPLDLLFAADTWKAYAAGFRDHGMASVLLGQTPEGPALFGIALTVLGLVAVFVAEGQRRRLALALWSVVVLTGGIVALVAAGLVRPPVATPTEAGVLASLAFAGLAGVAVGAFRLDLPRRGLGLVHAATLTAISVGVVLIGAGLGPALWHGEWEPGGGAGRDNSEDIAQVGALLQAEARQAGEFRVLWSGETWQSAGLSVARPVDGHFLTGARGHVFSDLFQRVSPDAENALHSVVASIESGATDRGGTLLGAFNVRYVVLGRDGAAAPWLDQRDLALIRTESRYLLLENQAALERAAVYPQVPAPVAAVAERDPALLPDATARSGFTVEPLSASRYSSERVAATGVLFLAEAAHPGWEATAGGARLERAEGGWGNAFTVPPSARGPLVVSFPRELSDLVWLVGIVLAWVVLLGAAFSQAKRVPGRPGGRRGPVTHRRTTEGRS
ncbi:MAG: glycosyltransferase family 2 protein [Actinomycetota bacterium]|nr:glycosyltransferase family 2 protein [Actinomycetota bacterium]